MASGTASPFSVDLEPELQQALKRWAKTAEQTVEEAQLAAQSIDPLQSTLQTMQSSMEFLSQLNWTKTPPSADKADVYNKILENFTELNSSAIQRLTEEQKNLFEALLAESQKYMEPAKPATNVQTTAAHYINQNLNVFNDVKQSMTEQTKTLANIQAAYNSLYQQSLSMLFGPAK